ncbi:initiation factor 2 subunit family-domain-containing protein [Terfezia claveryi]|nr:initiation factor 2 subunit family-domain-containing protein [Terfezia claveryi]
MSTPPTAAPAGPTQKPVTPKAPKPQKPKEDKPQKGKEEKVQKKDDAGPQAGALAPGGEAKLTPKQLKELKKADKQARRAADKATAGVASGGKPEVGAGGDKRGKPQQSTKGPSTEKKGGKADKAEKGSGATAAAHAGQAVSQRAPKNEIPLFRHLESPGRGVNLAGSHKDVHPAILALGLQMASYDICGSSARCVATLLAFKRVIEDYTTPAHTTLTRNLSSHHLSPQIEHLRSARPMSVSMRNAIRWLKLEISTINIDIPEHAAKKLLLEKIDSYIREKITIADHAIVATAVEKIVDGDVIVTFAKSNIVQMVLAEAHRKKIKFRVVVVDSRPLMEGAQLCQALSEFGIDCTYTLIHALSYAIRDATKVYLGAHAMLSNGRLYSRVGTAALAMYAKEFEVPVIVCCESIKFTDRVGLDSIVTNELALPDDLTNLSISRYHPTVGKLSKWRDIPNLNILNIMYDVTPAENITLVITEYGSLPPSSVPVVHRLSTNQ